MSFHTSPDDIKLLMGKLGTTNVNDVVNFLKGKDFATKTQWDVINKLGGAKAQLATNAAGKATLGAKLARFAGGNAFRNALRVVPVVGTGLAALDVADVVAGNDSILNKGMDATAMGIGGLLGAVGGPLGIAAGASTGKMISDGAQFLLGGGKSAEDRRIEEAIRELQAKGVI